MSELHELSTRQRARALIAFIDITGFVVAARRLDDVALAERMNEYYERVWRVTDAAGGRVVKYIGDGALLVWPAERADAGVCALLALARELEDWFADIGWRSRPIVKAHVGEVVAGPFGPAGHERFDVLGAAVNVAATIATSRFALTAEAFRSLSPETRRRFVKHTPPITYIRDGDPRPHRTGRG